ncbi:arylamine N-acetyltransferase [Candidatus Fermentibacterales bacterium]|nr:arylamine N-acetyltransferase [Candidatus Fermentibacterales bacterium]
MYGLRPGGVSIGVLRDVSRAFSRLPWENLTKLLSRSGYVEERGQDWIRGGAGVPPELLRGFAARTDSVDPGPFRLTDRVMEDHAGLGSGGTCFSLTNALGSILSDLGFTVFPLLADMRHGSGIHCALVVHHEGSRYLLDPGYLVPEPVKVSPEAAAEEVACGGSLMTYSFDAEGRSATLSTRSGDAASSTWRYDASLDPVSPRSFAQRWLQSFDASGLRSLHLNSMAGDRRLSAHNHNLRVDSGSNRENRKLRDHYPGEISRAFGISEHLAARAYEEWGRLRAMTQVGR